jgi:ankyrin repeat protein
MFALICEAALFGEDEQVMQCLEEGDSIETKAGEVQWTPLMYAVEGSNNHTAVMLIKNNANINFQDSWNETPLRIAIWHGNTFMVSYLIDRGVDMTSLNEYGETPLQTAFRERADIPHRRLYGRPLDKHLVDNVDEIIQTLEKELRTRV